MDNEIKTGGPAFPCHPETIPRQDQDFAGMTLRDYFAAKVMQGMAGSHANELRRMARKIGHPAGDVPAVMRAAADRIDELERLVADFQRAEAGG